MTVCSGMRCTNRTAGQPDWCASSTRATAAASGPARRRVQPPRAVGKLPAPFRPPICPQAANPWGRASTSTATVPTASGTTSSAARCGGCGISRRRPAAGRRARPGGHDRDPYSRGAFTRNRHTLAEEWAGHCHWSPSDRNDPRFITPRSELGYGMTAQWDDDIHHALHRGVR